MPCVRKAAFNKFKTVFTSVVYFVKLLFLCLMFEFFPWTTLSDMLCHVRDDVKRTTSCMWPKRLC